MDVHPRHPGAFRAVNSLIHLSCVHVCLLNQFFIVHVFVFSMFLNPFCNHLYCTLLQFQPWKIKQKRTTPTMGKFMNKGLNLSKNSFPKSNVDKHSHTSQCWAVINQSDSLRFTFSFSDFWIVFHSRLHCAVSVVSCLLFFMLFVLSPLA